MSSIWFYIITIKMDVKDWYDQKIELDNHKQNLKNKKIYFDSDGTEIKIGYDEQTWVGFVEIISD